MYYALLSALASWLNGPIADVGHRINVPVVLLGLQLQQAAIPAAAIVRKALGPLLAIFSLLLLGAIRSAFVVGQGVSDWLAARAERGGSWGCSFPASSRWGRRRPSWRRSRYSG